MEDIKPGNWTYVKMNQTIKDIKMVNEGKSKLNNKEIVKELASRIGTILLNEYALEIYKLGLKDGWQACENDFQARSTGEFEAFTLSEILEDAESELKRHI